MKCANDIQPDYANDFIDDCLTINPDYFMEYTDEQLKIKDILNNKLTENEARIFLLYVHYNKNIRVLSKHLNASNYLTRNYIRKVEQKILEAYD